MGDLSRYVILRDRNADLRKRVTGETSGTPGILGEAGGARGWGRPSARCCRPAPSLTAPT